MPTPKEIAANPTLAFLRPPQNSRVCAQDEGVFAMAVTEQDSAKRVDDLFVARAAFADAVDSKVRVGLGELYAFLTDPSATLTHEQQRLLFANSRLRADFRQLKQSLATASGGYVLPTAAAASDGELAERQFAGGAIRIAISDGHPDQVHLVLELTNSKLRPSRLIVECDGEVRKLQLDPPDEGVVQMLLDISLEQPAAVVRLLRQPRSEVTIL